MRRARIKAVATVPVRRKAALEATKTEVEKPTNEKTKEEAVKEIEKVDKLDCKGKTCNVENDKNINKPESLVKQSPTSPIKQSQKSPVKQLPVSPIKRLSISPVKQVPTSPVKKVPTSPVKQVSTSPVRENKFENSNIFTSKKDIENENKINNNVQVISKAESQQKVSTLIPTAEVSPIKTFQNRSCFMKPVPRLDGGNRIRRNSIQGSGASASESEDDSRKSAVVPSRVRNDSVCSVQSMKDGGNTHSVAKLNLGQKRRMVMSESARKLAEARREFLLKHENKSPDKNKLTMYDLIYYNPITNPMKPKPVTTRSNTRKISVCSIPEKNKNENEEEIEEPAEMLVPQVKVGPNGQLIIDEQSLVIDQYKAQENIDRSEILVDEDTNGSGFYKKRQKSKDWNKWETIKFYKALNTYGTDFSLMREKFPNRSRIELKFKYKKEERTNRALIEKALQYQEFDVEALEKDLASVEEKEKKEIELKEERKKNARKQNITPSTGKRKRKRCNVVAEEVNCENIVDDSKSKSSSEEYTSDDDILRIVKSKKQVLRARKIVKSDSSNENDNNSGSDLEVYETKKTRCGRVSKKPNKSLEKPITAPKNKKQRMTKRICIQKQNINEEETAENNDVIFDVVETNTCEDEAKNANSTDQSKKDINCVDKTLNDYYTIDIVENDPITVETLENTEVFSIENNSRVVLEIENNDNVILSEMNELSGNKKNLENEIFELQELPEKQIPKSLETCKNSAKNDIDNLADNIPNISNLKCGSLVVLKKDNVDDPEKTTLQVYMVSDDYDSNNPNYRDCLIPLDLEPDAIANITDCIKDIEPEIIS